MAYAKGAVPLTDLLDAPLAGQSVEIPGMRTGAVPLTFAPIAIGSKGPDVGYRVGGVDISNLCAAKGTARVVTDGGLPATLTRSLYVFDNVPTTALVGFAYRADGVCFWSADVAPPLTGTWAPGTGTPGDAYDIEFTQTASSGGGSLIGAGGGWLQVNTERAVQLSITLPPSGVGNIMGSRTVRIRIRDRASGAVLVDRTVNLYVYVERDL